MSSSSSLGMYIVLSKIELFCNFSSKLELKLELRLELYIDLSKVKLKLEYFVMFRASTNSSLNFFYELGTAFSTGDINSRA